MTGQIVRTMRDLISVKFPIVQIGIILGVWLEKGKPWTLNQYPMGILLSPCPCTTRLNSNYQIIKYFKILIYFNFKILPTIKKGYSNF